MRGKAAIAACVGLALLAGGCNPTETRFMREGIGTELYSSELAATSQLQEAYIGYICQQAGLTVVPTGDILLCSPIGMGPREWSLVVQAGLNDIDQRCDAYLGWLDNKRRSAGPILQQIHDMRTATEAIMRISGLGADPIVIAGTAFGLASATFTNIQSRLLLEVNHATVQTIVLTRQQEYRRGLLNLAIENRPSAIHALRSYLRICMPFTIETEINNTVTLAERGGPRGIALGEQTRLVTPATVRAAAAPQTSRTRVDRAGSQLASVQVVDAYRDYLEAFNPRLHSKTYVEGVLRALCVPPSEFTSAGKVRALIGIYEASVHQGSTRARANGVLDADEMSDLNVKGPCPSGFRNYYERQFVRSAAQLRGLVDALNKLPDGGLVSAATPLSGLRGKVLAVRRALRLEDSAIPDQVTPDLLDKLE